MISTHLPKLYGYYRSSAAYRTRIALNLKGLAYESVSLDLLKGQQHEPEYVRLNPERLVPLLETDGSLLSQSLAIIEYLDETWPEPALLPREPMQRAQVRAFALAIACDIHPLNNLRVLRYLLGPMKLTHAAKDDWTGHWIHEGLRPLEQLMANRKQSTRFCFGELPGLADICLVPQLANARRTNCDLAPYPTLVDIEANCHALDAFKRAAPENLSG